MYIEYTPLEGHLQNILRKPATAAALLAHVEAEEAATQVLPLQAEAVEEEAAANANNVAYRIAAPGAAGARATDTVPDQEQFTFKARRSISAENRLTSTPLLPNFSEVDEDIAEYELFDVIDSEEQQQISEVVQLQRSQEAANQQESVKNYTEKANEVVIELEDEDFEFVVTKVLKKDFSRSSLRNRDSRDLHKTISSPSSIGRHKTKRPLPALRPIPAALPISLTPGCSSYFLRESKSAPGPLLLNGNLHKFHQRSIDEDSYQSSCSSHESSSNSYTYVPRKRPLNSSRSYGNKNYNNLVEEECEEDFDYIESRTQVRLNTAAVDSTPEEAPADSQMGIDILNKIRNLLNLKSSANYDTNESKRKRRCDNWSPDAVDPHQIKYRKVDNNFPKFITGPLDDDIDSFPYPKKPKKQLLLQPSNRLSKSPPLGMAQRRSIHPNDEKPKQRKSIFAPPQTTHKLVKNTSYADVEFSDDDEPELINGFGYSAAGISTASHSGLNSHQNLSKAPKIYNIPISHRAEERLNFIAAGKPPPPPLIETRTCSILASSLLPELRAGRPTYADTLRQNISSFGGHVLGRAPSTISSSGASTSASARANYNGLSNCIRTNPWGLNARSILMHEKESEDREKYEELLKQLVPRIYGTDENAYVPLFKTAQPCTNASRRRSALGVVAANNSGGGNISANQQQQLQKSLQQQHQQQLLKRPPLSSTINLDDEDDVEDDDDVTIVNSVPVLRKSSRTKRGNVATVIIDDDDISDIIDLGDDERNMLSACSKLNINLSKDEHDKEKENLKKNDELPFVEPVNSLQLQFSTSQHLKDNWLENWQTKWEKKRKEHKAEVLQIEKEAKKHTEVRRAAEVEIQQRLKNFRIYSPDFLVIDDFPEPEEEPEFVELNAEYQAQIKSAICGAPDQVLISKFNLNITRRDIHTLLGHSWLNDEVINFYMNLLTERGETRHESDGLPRVYAMNTFFIPRLMQAGHGGVKRWTRKVDIFTKDVIPVPVHVGGVHWCMAIIHLKNRTIKYYDSMGTPNPNVLKALEQYLKDESMDKRKQPFDTTGFEVESVREVPRQMNGSDCGVFSCMFAEYISRNKEITFSQQHMEYFRHKMILEIVRGELLQ